MVLTKEDKLILHGENKTWHGQKHTHSLIPQTETNADYS